MKSILRSLAKLIEKKQAKTVPPNDEKHSFSRLSSSLKENIKKIKTDLGDSSDLSIRSFRLKKGIPAAVIYLDGLVNIDYIQQYLLNPLIGSQSGKLEQITDAGEPDLLSFLQNCVLTIGDSREVSEFEQLYYALLSGETLLLIDGQRKGLIASTRDWKERNVEEPSTQNVVKGSKEGFIETLRTNTAMIRRRVKDTRLRIDGRQLGRITKTDVAVVYLEGIAREEVVKEVHDRLNDIDIDGVLESGYLEDFIQDETYTPFPTVYYSERPDEVVSGILEGRVAILVDGTPFVIMVPALFI